MFGVVSEKVYVSKTGAFCVIFGLFMSNFFVLENIFSSIFLKQGNSYEVTANISKWNLKSEIRFNRKSQIISKLKQRERRKERECFRNKYNINFLFELLLLIAIEL